MKKNNDLISEIHFNCAMFGQLTCLQGFPNYYNISDICIYQLDSFHYLIPCKTGNHLQNCELFKM